MKQPNAVGVLIIDDANELRDVLEVFLRGQSTIRLIGSTTHVEDTRIRARDKSLEVILLGVRSTTRSDVIYLRHNQPQAAIILLGSLEVNRFQAVATHFGADSYIDKDGLVDALVPEIIRLANRENTY